ncbi:hypothetical protein [Halomonas sp. PA16-9]|uniref:hypothetical protein n=1 Tax=Halomonas sp. PA16-9 TaxID=2576841 RepID=UPI0030ECDBDA
MAHEQDIALAHLFTFYRAPLYLACHLNVSKALLERLQAQLDALQGRASDKSPPSLSYVDHWRRA